MKPSVIYCSCLTTFTVLLFILSSTIDGIALMCQDDLIDGLEQRISLLDSSRLQLQEDVNQLQQDVNQLKYQSTPVPNTMAISEEQFICSCGIPFWIICSQGLVVLDCINDCMEHQNGVIWQIMWGFSMPNVQKTHHVLPYKSFIGHQ